jgi:hypothetical protein
MEEGAGQVINRMRLTNSWVGCPAVARPNACGLAHIELHGAPTQAVMGTDARSYVGVKPFITARPIEESPLRAQQHRLLEAAGQTRRPFCFSGPPFFL